MGLGVLAFVVALIASIMLHEAGHLVTAKKFGMKAVQYFVGFGPTLWSFRRGETEYGVKGIPAGGFVKIVGMTDLEEIAPEDEDRAFYRQPAPQRAVVLAAGSFMHFVLALFLIYLTLVALGLPQSTREVSFVSTCVTKKEPDCKDQPASPAKLAGLRKGDTVVAFDGQPVESWNEDFADRVRTHPAGPATVTVDRDGRRLDLEVDVVRIDREDREHPGRLVNTGVIGLTPVLVYERVGPLAAMTETFKGMGSLFSGTAEAIVKIPGQVPDAFRQAFGDEERDPADNLTGIVGAAQLSGQAVRSGRIVDFLFLLAGLNVFIGVLNLLPLLPLDGGHLAILGYEQARSALARLFGRRDPGRVDIRKLMPGAYLVIVFFAGLTLLLLYSDITNPVANPFQ